MKCKHRKWRVLRSIWPYPEGWGVQCIFCGMIAGTGYSKSEAEDYAESLDYKNRKLEELKGE